MNFLSSLSKNEFIRQYFDLSQLRITSEVEDPHGLKHSFVFGFEQKFLDKTYARNIYRWMNQWWWLSIVYSIIYVILIYYGRSLMASRPRYELRLPLIFWNLGLAIFSLCGMTRCVPEMFYSLNKYGLEHTICDRSNIYGVTGYW